MIFPLDPNPIFGVEFIRFQGLRSHLRACFSRWNHESLRKHTSHSNQECVPDCTIMTLDDFVALDKGEWIGKERLRWAKLFSIPMAEETPPGFPRNTIQVSIIGATGADSNQVHRSRGL